MTDHTNTYPDLVNVEDWLNAKGYTGEAGACHQAMSLIRSQEKRIAEFEAVQLAQDKLILEYCSQITELENSEPAGFPEWVEAKNARIAELEAALRPFAYFDVFDLQFADLPDDYIIEGLSKRIGDLRAARAALGE